jgi:cytoskeletal protein RodZ
MPGLGDEFRAAREARHLSLSDVSEQLHIRAVYLESIESETWSTIAAPVYVRGFIRTYARFLNLDPEAAVAAYNATLGETEPTASRGSPSMLSVAPRRRPSPWLWVAGLAAAILVAFVGFKYAEFQRGGGAAATVAVEAPTSAPASPAAGSTAAPATSTATSTPASVPTSRTLQLRLTADSWLRISIDGKPVFEGILPAGTLKAYHGSSAKVRAGNAGGVDLTVNGKDLGAMGGPGDVVERTITLAAAE